jgi:hypothetical protein
MASVFRIGESMDNQKRKRVITLLLAYQENVLAGMRTAGALLIGNSALLYFQVIADKDHNFASVLLLGVILLLLASVPLGAIFNLYKKD